jgi:hypothetical protein
MGVRNRHDDQIMVTKFSGSPNSRHLYPTNLWLSDFNSGSGIEDLHGNENADLLPSLGAYGDVGLWAKRRLQGSNDSVGDHRLRVHSDRDDMTYLFNALALLYSNRRPLGGPTRYSGR